MLIGGCVPSQTGACGSNRWNELNQTDVDFPPPSGGAASDDVARAVLGSDTLDISNTDPTGLGSVPAAANHAEIHIWSSAGCGVAWTVSGVDPDPANAVGHRTSDGGHVELESAAEVEAFKVVAMPGCEAKLHVTYYELNTHVE